MRRAVVGWALLAGCGAADPYAVEVRFADGALAARRSAVEVRVVAACGTLGTTGADPEEVLSFVKSEFSTTAEEEGFVGIRVSNSWAMHADQFPVHLEKFKH